MTTVFFPQPRAEVLRVRARRCTVFTQPRVFATVTAPSIPVSTDGVPGQLFDVTTGALLYDAVSGAPLVW